MIGLLPGVHGEVQFLHNLLLQTNKMKRVLEYVVGWAVFLPPSNWWLTSAGDTRDESSIPGSGRSPGRGNGNLLQYSCFTIPMDREAWQGTVHGVAKIQIQRSNWEWAQAQINEQVAKMSQHTHGGTPLPTSLTSSATDFTFCRVQE